MEHILPSCQNLGVRKVYYSFEATLISIPLALKISLSLLDYCMHIKYENIWGLFWSEAPSSEIVIVSDSQAKKMTRVK